MKRKRGRSTQALRKLAEHQFHGCEVCMPSQAYDSLDELLSKLNLTRLERSRLEKNLFCPNCETLLTWWQAVVLYSDEENKHLRKILTWERRYSSQFDDFQDFLIKHPSLGGLHSMGEQLTRAIKKAKTTILEPRTWYRSRSFTPEVEELSSEDFFAPMPQKHKVDGGRFNSAGQAAYYLADSPDTATVEQLKNKKYEESKIWIARIGLLKSLKVLDLRRQSEAETHQFPILLYGLLYTGKISEALNPDDRSNPQYRVPQFISDLVRWRKLDGILYTSTQPHPFFKSDVFGSNLVMLHLSDNDFKVLDFNLYSWVEKPNPGLFGLPEMVLGHCY